MTDVETIPESYGWDAATKELEAILVQLDDDQLDVDRVAELVERAAALVAYCRGRLRSVRRQVDDVIDSLEG